MLCCHPELAGMNISGYDVLNFKMYAANSVLCLHFYVFLFID